MSGGAGPAPRTGLVARWALHVALIAALGAFVVARGDRSPLVLLIPLALVPALRWSRASRVLVTLLPVLARVALVGTLALAVLSRQLRFIQEAPGLRFAGILGWTLAVLAVVFILGHRIWPVTGTLLPAIVGVFVVSGLKPGIGLFPYFAAAGALALWTFAFVHGGPRRLGLPLAGFLGLAALVSVGTLQLLPWAQPHVERAVARTFAEGTSGLSEESRLGEFGELAVSDRVVLRVWTRRPRLLRAYVFTRFDGIEWSAGDRRETWGVKPLLPRAEGADRDRLSGLPGNLFEIPGHGEASSTGDLVETRILQSATADWPLLVPANAHLVRAPVPYLLRSRDGELRGPPNEPARLYGVLHETGRRSDPALDTSLSAQAAALGLPARLDPRLRILAGALYSDADSDRARLDNTMARMHSGYTYSLDVGEFETSDPVAEFLFEKKAGYCEYFATAAAVLLRMQGIPARYVKGFSVAPHSAVPGRFGMTDYHLVRESDAHAWVEAWIEGEGWVEADPTPPAGLLAWHRREPGWLAQLAEAVRAHAAELRALLMHDELVGVLGAVAVTARGIFDALWRRPWIAGAVVALLLAALSWRRARAWWTRLRSGYRARKERRVAFPGELSTMLAAVEHHWARRGRPRPPTRGLREHLESLSPDLSGRERDASARVVDACYRTAYGGALLPPDEMGRLRREVARLGLS